jgi:hypothetical protein
MAVCPTLIRGTAQRPFLQAVLKQSNDRFTMLDQPTRPIERGAIAHLQVHVQGEVQRRDQVVRVYGL